MMIDDNDDDDDDDRSQLLHTLCTEQAWNSLAEVQRE